MSRDPIFHYRISEVLMAWQTEPDIQDFLDFFGIKGPESFS